jgi:ketosteroid isomerase-like protein
VIGEAMPSRTQAEAEEPLPTEDAFFQALVEGDVASLGALLADDFVIVDVQRGGEIGRRAFLDAIASRYVRFEALSVVERRARRYGEVAVVVGRTDMRGEVGGERFAAASRYTHVFARVEAGRWRLVSAQGTQIVE